MLTISAIFRALSFASVLAVLLPATGQAQRATLTRNADERGLVPYQSTATTYCTNGNGVCEIDTFKTVPVGFRLVVTHVSCWYNNSTAAGHLSNYFDLKDSSSNNDVMSVPVAPFPSGAGMLGNSPVTFYVEPGAHPHIIVWNAKLSTTTQATVVGYLVAIS